MFGLRLRIYGRACSHHRARWTASPPSSRPAGPRCISSLTTASSSPHRERGPAQRARHDRPPKSQTRSGHHRAQLSRRILRPQLRGQCPHNFQLDRTPLKLPRGAAPAYITPGSRVPGRKRGAQRPGRCAVRPVCGPCAGGVQVEEGRTQWLISPRRRLLGTPSSLRGFVARSCH